MKYGYHPCDHLCHKSAISSCEHRLAKTETWEHLVALAYCGVCDFVLTDIQMPRMDGFILVQNMRRIDSLKDIPVIIVSSVFEQDTLQIVKELNAEYIVKSDFERENLISKAKELLHDQ